MQQFTVPQFIDVENQIIGPLTVRQFMILLAAAIIIGVTYRLFDFGLFLTVAAVVAILASTFSFAKINGRPFHFFILNAVQTWRRPGLRIWDNRAVITAQAEKLPDLKVEYRVPAPKLYKTSRLAELSLIVDTKGKYKGE